MNVGFHDLENSCDSDLHLRITCNHNRLYDRAECQVVILSKKTTSIDKELGVNAPGRHRVPYNMHEKYQKGNGVMYHERLCQFYA